MLALDVRLRVLEAPGLRHEAIPLSPFERAMPSHVNAINTREGDLELPQSARHDAHAMDVRGQVDHEDVDVFQEPLAGVLLRQSRKITKAEPLARDSRAVFSTVATLVVQKCVHHLIPRVRRQAILRGVSLRSPPVRRLFVHPTVEAVLLRLQLHEDPAPIPSSILAPFHVRFPMPLVPLRHALLAPGSSDDEFPCVHRPGYGLLPGTQIELLIVGVDREGRESVPLLRVAASRDLLLGPKERHCFWRGVPCRLRWPGYRGEVLLLGFEASPLGIGAKRSRMTTAYVRRRDSAEQEQRRCNTPRDGEKPNNATR
mmetsp:Transcript_117016/g.331151  ORF Transcript_117016/g.331151 Transcript_117016/m.331151 type:complete len:314 (+) Transcript_117016:634-1575(+)